MRLSRKLLHLGPFVLRGKPLSHLFQLTELRSLTHGPSFHLQSQQCSMFKSFSFHQPIASIPLTSPVQFSRSVVSDSAILWTAAHQASLSTTNSQSLPRLMSIESVMPSNHLILCHPLLFLTSYFPIIRSSVMT